MQFFTTIALAFACLSMAAANPLERVRMRFLTTIYDPLTFLFTHMQRCAGNIDICTTTADCCAGLSCTGIIGSNHVCQTG